MVAPPTAPPRRPRRADPDALIKEARDRQRRRRQKGALLALLIGGIGGIGYGIDRTVSGGHSAPPCAAGDCSGSAASASSAAPIIVSVLSEPSDLKLRPGPAKIVPGKASGTKGLNVVPAPRGLAFKVTLRNTSTTWERDVTVTLTIYAPSRSSTVETKRVNAIAPHQTGAVVFGGRFLVPFAQATKIKVEVATVSSGQLTVKRAIDYPVIFSLP